MESIYQFKIENMKKIAAKTPRSLVNRTVEAMSITQNIKTEEIAREIDRRALCEVADILENTEEVLIDMLPSSLVERFKNSKLENYVSQIVRDVPLEEQKLIPETEAIISEMFRKYWISDDEKEIFARIDRAKFLEESERVETLEKNRLNPIVALVTVKKKVGLLRKLFSTIKVLFEN